MKQRILKELKIMKEVVRQTYGAYLPTSKKKKEAFLEKVREKVAFYKPRVEEECKVDLGDIKVKDFNCCIKDHLDYRIKKELREYRKYVKREGKKPSKFCEESIKFPVLTIWGISKPLIWAYMSISGFEMKYYNSSLYVPFYHMNRFMDIDFKRRTERLDNTVVHELSHKVWYLLGGHKPRSGERNWNLFSEGFAAYCADKHLLSIYPKGVEVKGSNGGIYKRGKQEIEKLVQKYGKDIVLDVPKKWGTLSQTQ